LPVTDAEVEAALAFDPGSGDSSMTTGTATDESPLSVGGGL
jgi:hypothetical protein